MKTISLFLLLLFSCAGEKVKNDLITQQLKGRVKVISENTYSGIEKFGEYQKDGIPTNTTYKYDDRGYLSEMVYPAPDGSVIIKFVIGKIDDKGNRTEGNMYDRDGNLSYRWTYKYDEKGNKIDENCYNPNGKLDSKTTYMFDKKNNKTEENKYKADGSLDSKITFEYDTEGNIIGTVRYRSDGSLDSRSIYKNDVSGNTIECRSSGDMNYTNTYEYVKFDNKNNWIRKNEFSNGKITNIIEREIEYYKLLD